LAYLPDSEIANPLEPAPAELALKQAIVKRWPSADLVLGRYAPPAAYLEAAARTGRLLCRQGAVAREVEVDATGKVSGVVWYDRATGEMMRARAPLIFLCASALESTRILLLSRSSRSREGLGFASKALGRHLMDHVTVKAEGIAPGLEGEPVLPEDGRCVYLPRFDRWDDEGPGAASRGYGLQIYQMSAGKGRSYFTGVGFAEMLPRPENRVVLDSERKDKFGIPVLRIMCRHGEDEIAVAKRQSSAFGEIAKLAAAKLSRLDVVPSPPGTAVHECGTARMGLDPTCSVLDPNNECWDARGLYVTDASSFPSQGSQNPTLTILALTARACDHALRSVGSKLAA
jgi:choline dehydrogenase-like flavoprotein